MEPTQTSEAPALPGKTQTCSETAARGGGQRAVARGSVDGQDLLSRPVLPGLSPVFLMSLLREAPAPPAACSCSSQHSHHLTASRRSTFSRVKSWGQACSKSRITADTGSPCANSQPMEAPAAAPRVQSSTRPSHDHWTATHSDGEVKAPRKGLAQGRPCSQRSCEKASVSARWISESQSGCGSVCTRLFVCGLASQLEVKPQKGRDFVQCSVSTTWHRAWQR